MSQTKKSLNVILDTDIGVDIDDDLAILTLLGIRKSAKTTINICGITTIGFCPSLKALQCRTLLQSLGYDHIPVFVGSSTDLENRSFNPFTITNIIFLFCYICNIFFNLLCCKTAKTTKEPKYDYKDMSAVDAMIHFAQKYEHSQNKLNIICIGPLTNIARAIQNDSHFLERINSLTIMGGGYTLNANNNLIVDDEHGGSSNYLITAKKDTNLRSDKISVRVILNQAKKNGHLDKIVFVPVDMTLKMYLTRTDCNEICEWIDEQCFVLKYIKWSFIPWSFVQTFICRSDRSKCFSYLHDPLTVCVGLLCNDIILDANDNNFGLQFKAMGYSDQRDTQKHPFSKSRLIESSFNLNNNHCRILTAFNVKKMKHCTYGYLMTA